MNARASPTPVKIKTLVSDGEAIRQDDYERVGTPKIEEPVIIIKPINCSGVDGSSCTTHP